MPQEQEQAQAQALPPETDLGEYILGPVLGDPGGFGITYLARHPELPKKRYAIKELFPADLVRRGEDGRHVVLRGENKDQLAINERRFAATLQAFLDEARVLDRIDGDRHPEIVKIVGFFRAHHTAYIVMPYYQGLTLAARVGRGVLDEAFALGVLRSVLRGLRVVHREGQLHRDIKPENVYLRDGVQAVLLDFGNARQVDEQGMVARSRGVDGISEGFSPPEQRGGRMGAQGDLYSVGALLYFCFTGVRPVDALRRVAGAPLEPSIDSLKGRVSAPLVAFIQRCLLLDPAHRLPDVDAALADLRPLLEPRFDWASQLPPGHLGQRLQRVAKACDSGRSYALGWNTPALLLGSGWLFYRRALPAAVAVAGVEAVLGSAAMAFSGIGAWVAALLFMLQRLGLAVFGDWLLWRDLGRQVAAWRQASPLTGAATVQAALTSRLSGHAPLGALALVPLLLAALAWTVEGWWAEGVREQVSTAIQVEPLLARIAEFRAAHGVDPQTEDLALEPRSLPALEQFRMQGPHLQITLRQPEAAKGRSVRLEFDPASGEFTCVNQDLPPRLTPKRCRQP